MLIEKLKKMLSTQKLSNFLDTIDVHTVWKFDEREQDIITTLLRSDSQMAFDVAVFIIEENSRYAEPLIPLLLELSPFEESKRGNRFRGKRVRDLLLDVLFSKNIAWRDEFLEYIIEGLCELNLFTRVTTIELVLNRFNEIFPHLYSGVADKEYTKMEDIKKNLSFHYEQFQEKTPEIKSHDVYEFVEVFQQKKRLIRALYLIVLIRGNETDALKEKVQSEDSYILDYLKFFEARTRLRTGAL